jgi:DNA processing protein
MPPKTLFHCGADVSELLKRPCLAIVGSRAVSAYGREVTAQLARELAARGVVIISGLAYGVDSIAHKAALEVGGATIAVLPGPIEVVYPRAHQQLAQAIVNKGGALMSEYSGAAQGFDYQFVARNRLIAGLADAVLITEAALKSGSLHTARFALEQGKDVLAVPGNITNPVSVGTNNLIKAGATPITAYTDVLHALGLEEAMTQTRLHRGSTPAEQCVLDLLQLGICEGDALLKDSNLSVSDFSQALTMLEIAGAVRPLGSNQWRLQ